MSLNAAVVRFLILGALFIILVESRPQGIDLNPLITGQRFLTGLLRNANPEDVRNLLNTAGSVLTQLGNSNIQPAQIADAVDTGTQLVSSNPRIINDVISTISGR